MSKSTLGASPDSPQIPDQPVGWSLQAASQMLLRRILLHGYDDSPTAEAGWEREFLESQGVVWDMVIGKYQPIKREAVTQEWQPIETAPKGELLLVGRFQNQILAWSQPAYWADGWALPFDSEREEGVSTPFLDEDEQPTHWLCVIPRPILKNRNDRAGYTDLNNEGDPLIYGAGEVLNEGQTASATTQIERGQS